MKHLGLFEGIGGFSLAARNVGWETLAWCEWNEFGQKVLRHHFPEAEGFGDITKTNFKKYANTIDIITGGFPCQPFSTAGKRKGTDDERYLWGEMLRAIQEVKPKYVIAENVFGITNIDGGLVFEQVCIDLEAEGYEVQSFIIPAAAQNAPHRRDRCWFIGFKNVTNSQCNGLEYGSKTTNIRSEEKKTCEKWCKFTTDFTANGSQSNWQVFPTQSPICGGDDGLPTKLDGITFPKWRSESIKAYGNAIVPQVAEQIFRTIIDYENTL